MHSWRFASLGLIGLFMACGGTVEQGPMQTGGNAGATAGGAAGSAGTSAQGGWAGSPKGGSSGAGGIPASGSGGGPGGGPPDAGPPDAAPDVPTPCVQTVDTFSMKAALYNGQQLGCGAGTTNGVFEMQGIITAPGTNSFELDSCPPNANCMPMLSNFAFDAPGLEAWFPPGVFVSVKVQVNPTWACTEQIEITNLPSWAGVTNPVSTDKLIYLSASDGVAEALPGSDLAVHKQQLGCSPGPSCGSDPADMYVLYFGAIWQSSLGMPVYMGTTAFWDFKGPGGTQYLQVRNLRSF